jgi:hypothetical protein
MPDPKNPINSDDPPKTIEIAIELGSLMASQLKRVSRLTGLSESELTKLGLQKILIEQLEIIKVGQTLFYETRQ